jgi:DNA-binding protein HU-beta
MNKAELIDSMLKDKASGFDSKAHAERALNAVVEGIKKGLKGKDKSVQLIGFGTFTVKQRKGRMGRNPRTGAALKIKPSKTVGFKAGKALKGEL